MNSITSYYYLFKLDILSYTSAAFSLCSSLIQARNLPVDNVSSQEEYYKHIGHTLYQQAQALQNRSPSGSKPGSLHIQNVTQAAVVGLYASQVLSPHTDHREPERTSYDVLPVANTRSAAPIGESLPYFDPNEHYILASDDPLSTRTIHIATHNRPLANETLFYSIDPHQMAKQFPAPDGSLWGSPTLTPAADRRKNTADPFQKCRLKALKTQRRQPTADTKLQKKKKAAGSKAKKQGAANLGTHQSQHLARRVEESADSARASFDVPQSMAINMATTQPIRFSRGEARPANSVNFDAPRQLDRVIAQCKISISPKMLGNEVTNLNPESYGDAKITELRAPEAPYHPARQRYVDLDGIPVAVRPVVFPKHGVKYEMFDETAPESSPGYPLSVNGGQWRLQEPTTLQLSDALTKAIPADMLDNDCTDAMLSVPDGRGIQWTRDNQSYLRIYGRYVRIMQNKNNVNHYCLQYANNQHAITVQYHKSRFRLMQELPSQAVNLQAITLEKRNKQVIKINSWLMKAEQHLKNKDIIRSFQAMRAAFAKHKISEAGSIKRLAILTLNFIDIFIISKNALKCAEVAEIQAEWMKNVMIPLKSNKMNNEKKLYHFSKKAPRYFKNITEYLHQEQDYEPINKIATALATFSMTSIPQYALESRPRFYEMAPEGCVTETKGNEVLFQAVNQTLDVLNETASGR